MEHARLRPFRRLIFAGGLLWRPPSRPHLPYYPNADSTKAYSC